MKQAYDPPPPVFARSARRHPAASIAVFDRGKVRYNQHQDPAGFSTGSALNSTPLPSMQRTERDRAARGTDVTAAILGDPIPGRSAQDKIDDPNLEELSAQQLYENGVPVAEISRALGLHPASVKAILRRNDPTKLSPQVRKSF